MRECGECGESLTAARGLCVEQTIKLFTREGPLIESPHMERVIAAHQLQHDPTQWLPIPLCAEPQGCSFHDPYTTLELTVRTSGAVMAVVVNDLGMWRAEGLATHDGDEVVNRITWHPEQTASTLTNEYGGTNYHLLVIADPSSYPEGESLNIGLSLTEYSSAP